MAESDIEMAGAYTPTATSAEKWLQGENRDVELPQDEIDTSTKTLIEDYLRTLAELNKSQKVLTVNKTHELEISGDFQADGNIYSIYSITPGKNETFLSIRRRRDNGKMTHIVPWDEELEMVNYTGEGDSLYYGESRMQYKGPEDYKTESFDGQKKQVPLRNTPLVLTRAKSLLQSLQGKPAAV